MVASMLDTNGAPIVSPEPKPYWNQPATALLDQLESSMEGLPSTEAKGRLDQAGRNVLQAQVSLKATVLRDGQPTALPVEEIVPGDVVLLSAGSLIPADGILLEAQDCYVNQAVLTGETFPVEKYPDAVSIHASLAERTNCVYMGTNVRSGRARVLVVQTGGASAEVVKRWFFGRYV
jgi:P-type E1-E2 ATPase